MKNIPERIVALGLVAALIPAVFAAGVAYGKAPAAKPAAKPVAAATVYAPRLVLNMKSPKGTVVSRAYTGPMNVSMVGSPGPTLVVDFQNPTVFRCGTDEP